MKGVNNVDWSKIIETLIPVSKMLKTCNIIIILWVN